MLKKSCFIFSMSRLLIKIIIWVYCAVFVLEFAESLKCGKKCSFHRHDALSFYAIIICKFLTKYRLQNLRINLIIQHHVIFFHFHRCKCLRFQCFESINSILKNAREFWKVLTKASVKYILIIGKVVGRNALESKEISLMEMQSTLTNKLTHFILCRLP